MLLHKKILESTPGYNFKSSPGLALIATIGNDEVIRLEMGLANIEYNIPFTVDTVSHAASIMKQFTAYAIALLIEDNTLKTSNKVKDYLKDFPKCGQEITIEQLIDHTSGLRDQWDLLLMAGWRLDDVITTDHIWKIINHQEKLNFEPGTDMLYSNTGYSVLAEIIQKVTSKPFETYLDDQVITPVGLPSTFILTDHRTVIKNRAYGYQLGEHGTADFKRKDLSFSNIGATSLFTSVSDLNRWAKHQNCLFSQTNSLARRVSGEALSSGNQLRYVYGTWISNQTGTPVVFHDGWDAGYKAAVIRIPEKNTSVSVLSNGLEIPTLKLAFDAIQELFGHDDFRPEKLRALPEPQSLPEQLSTEDPLVHLLFGTYKSRELMTEYYISSPDGQLEISHSRHPTKPLFRNKNHHYFGPSWLPSITFFSSSSGAIEGFNAHSGRVRCLPFYKT